jgi:hypothetical protein
MTTLATILDTVIDETGYEAPSSYFGNTDEAAKRGRVLANASAQYLVTLRHRNLIKTGTIDMTTATTYAVPADVLAFVQDTMYEQGDSQPVHFPTTDQQFAVVNASGVGDGVLTNVRIIDGNFEIDEPKNGETLEYTYRSKHPIQATGGGATKAKYTADTDVWLLDDRLHELDIIWRWRKLHGMDYQDDLAMYKRYERSYLGRDGGYRSINFNSQPGDSIGGARTDLWV